MNVFRARRVSFRSPIMKHARSLAIVLAALAASLYPQNIRAEVELSFAYFQEALSPFGEWIEVGDYGLCWRPTGVPEDWAPYTDGYWAYTDAGWTWVSYEDWGGITYHYGRWIHVVDEGWVWVPEYEWAPAWVSWRSNDDYVGWAPLPPEARWEEDTGFSTWVDTSYDIGPDNYRFCHTRDFGSPFLAPVLLPCERNVTIIQTTVNITNITFNRHNSHVFCGGPDFGRINRDVHRPIPSLKLQCEDREVRGPHGNRTPQIVRGNQIALYAPKVKRPVDLKALPITPRRVVGADKVNRGWSRVPDLAAQEQIKQRLQKQSEGLNPRTAPARPVKPADLAGVPTKADPTARPPTAVVSGPARNPGRPSLPSLPSQPKRPVAETRPVAQPAHPAANPPAVAESVDTPVNPPPHITRPIAAKPAGNPPVSNNIRPPQSRPEPSRPPQVAVPNADARAAEVERGRAQQQQQQQDNAQRSAIARQQAESAQRASQARDRQVQPQQSEQRTAEVRNQEAQARRQQADAASRQQENALRAQRANETRQQAVQHQQAAQRANEGRQEAAQQQQAAQRANEMRQQAVQQQAAVARHREESVQRANEQRQQQQARPASPQREYVAPPSRPAQQEQSRPAPAPKKEGDDDNKRQRSGR